MMTIDPIQLYQDYSNIYRWVRIWLQIRMAWAAAKDGSGYRLG